MRRVTTGEDEWWSRQREQVLRFGARRGVPIDERVTHIDDEMRVQIEILAPVRARKLGIAAQERAPRSAAGILAERLARGLGQRGPRLQAVRPRIRDMLGEPRVTGDAIGRAADGPPQEQTQRRLWMRDRERDRGRASHAPAQDVCARDAEVIEESERLTNVMRPRDALDAAAGLPGLTAVGDEAPTPLRHMFENPAARARGERRPHV